MNLESTAQAIDAMAGTLRDLAKRLDHLAARTRETNDPVYASEAVGAVANTIPNLRLDLMVTRPMREAARSGSGD